MSILSVTENYEPARNGRPWSYTIKTTDYTIHLVCTDFSDRHAAARSTRVYATNPILDIPAPEYTTRGEDPANDKAWDAYNRAEVKAMKAELETAADELISRYTPDQSFSAISVALTEGLKFSRKAGCSCGCSAGFVSPKHVSFRGNGIKQISISRNEKKA